jgi:uncharacterized glyoxalase superfamily protein PhnB
MPQTVTPYLLYEDATAALEWLSKAFGFREVNRIELDDGSVNHAELDVGDGGIVYLGHPPGDGYRNPKKVGQTALVYVVVADADSHCRHAKEAGARVLEEPADQEYGDRRYGVEDPEGHHWFFAHRIGGAEQG